MTITDRQYAEARAVHRRHVYQRQTVIFGSISLVLVFLFTISWLQWLEIIPSPFQRDFSTSAPSGLSTTVACPAEGTVLLEAKDIHTIVLNSTPTAGMARTVADQLAAAGVNIIRVGNYPDSVVQGPGVIEVGPQGHAAGYSLQALLPGFPVMEVDQDGKSATVVIGMAFRGVNEPSALRPGRPVVAPAECASRSAEALAMPFLGSPGS